MGFLDKISDSTFHSIGNKFNLFQDVKDIRERVEDICSNCERRAYICGAYTPHPQYCEEVSSILRK